MNSNGRKKLVAIDGNSLLYRAFFAMRHLSTTDGLPTNALYGLTMMLLRVLDEKPDYILVAFDTPMPTFRHEEYEDYKAHRKPVADALAQQAPIARELVRAFNIPVVEVPGFEADDVIGAVAKKAEQEGVDTLIVTGDLDALQLVDDHIRVMTTVKGVTDTVIYDPATVEKRFGIKPEQMADYKALKGDPSDNIPGVPGIGDKTAAELLRKYGSLDNLLEHLDELPDGKVKKALQENIDLAVLSKRLVTIVTDLPLKINLEDYRAREPDYDALRDLFVRLEFKTMLKRLPEVGEAKGKTPLEQRPALGTCRTIGSDTELSELVSRVAESEAFSLHCHVVNGKSIDAELIGLGLSIGSNDTAYVAVFDPVKARGSSLSLQFDGVYQADLDKLSHVMSNERPVKYCHDAKLNYAALALRGIELKGVQFDTMLAAYLLDPDRSSYKLGDVAFEQLDLELPGVTRKKDEAKTDVAAECCGEAEAIYRLKPVLESRLREHGLYDLLMQVELPLAPILAEMELTGIAVDVEQLEALSITLDAEIRQLEQSIYRQAGEEFNIGSPKQLQRILFEKLGLVASVKTKTGYSTSAAVLEELAYEYPIVEDILRYRELTKIKSTYADALPKLINPVTGRIHTSLNQTVTATGRLSSSDPNLQNIPIRTELGRQIRRAFVASGSNLLLSADYSQIELRILAHVAHDENLIRAFENDEDIHLATACAIFNCAPSEVTPEMRRRAKTVNFAVIYGMADFTLSRTLGISVKEARQYIDTYFARFPGVKAYIEETIESARQLGYVSTLMGRRRYIPDINSSNRNVRMFAERQAINAPIQGTAADIMKLAMISVDKALKTTSSKMLLQVHDELLFEVPPEEVSQVADLVRKHMEGAYELCVPLRVDVKVGRNWADMEAVPSSNRSA